MRSAFESCCFFIVKVNKSQWAQGTENRETWRGIKAEKRREHYASKCGAFLTKKSSTMMAPFLAFAYLIKEYFTVICSHRDKGYFFRGTDLEDGFLWTCMIYKITFFCVRIRTTFAIVYKRLVCLLQKIWTSMPSFV